MANPMFAARYKISYNEGVQTIPVRADLGHMRGFFILKSSLRDKRECLPAIAAQ
jgi:hypothetical protein